MTTIRVPTPLRPYTDGAKDVTVAAKTVEEALRLLAEAHPDLAQHLFDESGRLRSYISLFVNDEDVRSLSGGDTELATTDRLMIVPSIAGGRVDLFTMGRALSSPESSFQGFDGDNGDMPLRGSPTTE